MNGEHMLTATICSWKRISFGILNTRWRGSETMTLAHWLDEAYSKYPEKTAIVSDDKLLTYSGLRDMAIRLASAFAKAGLAGGRVATLLPNCGELIACYMGCWASGVTMVPFEYVDAPPEILTGILDCNPQWLIVHEEKLSCLFKMDIAKTSIRKIFVVGTPPKGMHHFAELLAASPHPLPTVSPDSLAFILYTSGSTALPKGVTHSHASAAGIVESVLSALEKVTSDSKCVVHDPVSHMGGWIEVFPLLCRGATVILDRDFDVTRYYHQLRRWRPTITTAHVHQLWQIVQYPQAQRNDFASVDTVFTGGDELPNSLQRAFMSLTGLPIQVGWGMTEAIWLTIAREPNLERRGFMGRPVAHVQLRLVDRKGCDVPDGVAGELWVKGPMVTSGYWNRPEINSTVLEGGWLRTGDVGMKDKNGDYWFCGRIKNIIERGSENITPGEIEQGLYRHPAIAEAAVFGVPDAIEGEVPVAYVCFKAGHRLSEAELKSFLATQIAEFKIPAHIFPIESMPLTASGKIHYKALLNLYEQKSIC